MPQVSSQTDKQAREAWRTAPLEDLVLYIVERYHLATRMELARLENLTEAAALLCGHTHPGLVELRDEAARLGMEMRAHLVFEEREVFPSILAQCKGTGGGLPPELLQPMKQILIAEHEAEAGHFRHIRRLVEDLAPFEDPRGLHPKLLAALRLLAEDLQHHIFLENQILFVRAFQ